MNSITVHGVAKEFDRLDARGRSTGQFVALDDISFEAQPGDIIGILGRNGAGKSTLLKILARILRPTRGRVELRGRLGTLLEVGTGFHPELTGRENIFLNAAILGMNRAEVLRKFDAIVDFAGTADHLDQPVKHYSSGMTMRLAFAVAAHVEPEILLMDEVLAVGDADFQRKCLERVAQVGRNGQTVIFVSHNIHAVLRLCNRALLLDHGKLIAQGNTREVAATYLQLAGGDVAERVYPDLTAAPGDRVARLRGVRVCAQGGETIATLDIGEGFAVELRFDLLVSGMTVFPTVIINNEWGPVSWATDSSTPAHGTPRPAGSYQATVWFPANVFGSGRLSVTVALLSFSPHTEHFREVEVVAFQAMETYGGSRGLFAGHIDGGYRPLLRWQVEMLDEATP